MEEVVAASVGQQRLISAMAGVFALLAALLAMVGVFGVMTYNVRRQRREIGIRLALGAERAAVRRLILTRGLRLAALGSLGGALGAYLLTGTLQTMLDDVTPNDPLVFGGTAVAVLVAAMLASYLPALSAGKTDPMIVLRDSEARARTRCGMRGRIYSGDACSKRHSSHHRDLGERAAEPRFLCGRSRDAAREEEREPGRSRHLPPLLCGRGRASRYGPDVFPVGTACSAGDGPWPCERSPARSAARQPGVLERASRKIQDVSCCGDSIRHPGPSVHRSARVESGARRGRLAASVCTVGREPDSGAASDSRTLRRTRVGAGRVRDGDLPAAGSRFRAARNGRRVDALRISRRRRCRRHSRDSVRAARPLGHRRRPSSCLARR